MIVFASHATFITHPDASHSFLTISITAAARTHVLLAPNFLRMCIRTNSLLAINHHHHNSNTLSCCAVLHHICALSFLVHCQILFQPSLIGSEASGIHEMVYQAVLKCDVDIRKDLYASLALAGGTAALSGFPQRLEREVAALAPVSMRVRVRDNGSECK